jgi:hypothetical protein
MLITIANTGRPVEAGKMDCMPNTDVEKLAGRKIIEIIVKIRMFWPCFTVVRASRTAEALNN